MSRAFDQNTIFNGNAFRDNIISFLNIYGFRSYIPEPDAGVDIVATKIIKDTTYIFNIQCKYYNTTVGNKAIQEVITGGLYHKTGGRPVVITNNYFTVETGEYAAKLDVELIGKTEWDILNSIDAGEKKPDYEIKGLLGLIIGLKLKDPKYFDKSKQSTQIKIPKNKDSMRTKIITNYDIAEQWLHEAAKLSMQAVECQQKALKLQKEALLTNLEYY